MSADYAYGIEQFGYVTLPFGFYYLTVGEPMNFFFFEGERLQMYRQIWGRLFRMGYGQRGNVTVRMGR